MLCTCIKAQVYIAVNIDQPSALVNSAGTNQTICSGESTSIGGSVTGGKEPYTFTWSPSSGLSSPAVANPVASPSVTTVYSLIVTDANNCKRTESVTVTVQSCSTSINTVSNSSGAGNFSIVPNPNHGLFSVVLSSVPSDNALSLEVYNFLGEHVYSVSFLTGNTLPVIPVDMGKMNKGIYLIKALWENGSYTEKLILE